MTTQPNKHIFDFFISYKHSDSTDFARSLHAELVSNGSEVWLDKEQINPGDSILSGIELGLRSSVDAIVILSKNYFSGWSEQERRSLYSLMVSQRMRVIPIWYRLTHAQVMSLSPLFADIKAIEANLGSRDESDAAAKTILNKYNPKQRESRLYEIFFRAVRSHVDDPDLDLFISVFSNDTELLEASLKAGADVNITDGALWNRYSKITLDWKDVFPAWRALFLHLCEVGAIGPRPDQE